MGLMLKHVLSHDGGRRSYRRVFPQELRPFVPGGAREHKVSLGREGDPGFLSRYEKAAREYDGIVATARKRLEGAFDQLDAPTIAYLAEAFRVESLENDETARYDTEEQELFIGARAQLDALGVAHSTRWPGDARLRWADKRRETVEPLLSICRDFRAVGDIHGIVDYWREEALELCEARGLVVDEGAEEQMRRLCRALNDASISAMEDMLRRLTGDDVQTPPEPVRQPQPAPTGPQGKPLSFLALFDGYTAAQGVSPGVRKEWRNYIQRLIDFLGHDDATRLTAERLMDWRDALLAEKLRSGKLRTPTTVRDKYITSVRATLTWAVQEKKLPKNVAADVVVRVPKKTKLRDADFTAAEAKAILCATLIKPTTRLSPSYVRARRWVPWLCAYTGARVNEFSQLRGEDVLEIDGIWVVRITPEAGSTKTKEARTVPLHEHLVEQGFVQMVKAHGPGPLFYEPSRKRAQGDANRHFKKVGEKLAAWVRNEVGITDPGIKPNHAWRHLFKTMSYDAGIEERLADAIQGHAPKTTGRTYGKPTLKALAEAIGKLPRFEVDGARSSEDASRGGKT